ncbi:uncharacterized protein [Elaeis guineensis]|uniref:Uncharacterized protein LOC105043300 isoform X1 n=2 Tax=Elaeis guineensis var. tenera TaxID=51953 RepID=A0A6I9R1V6_ELAGV|nr:uncharacterized protein LOC105043300 isoform X1 [Elaeis guineensis]XP_010919098.1 uncharacterized protein LOC105043300 isoform X1 [Elaeis guineensis]
MIRLCTCTRGSPSALEYPNHREGSNSCKSCGGKLAVDRQGSLSGSMLSTVGLELSRVIDPQLNWKKASKGRQRTVRRARTSFPGGNKKRSTTKSLKDSEDAADKELKRAGDIPVSESEKLGVSILGRRFSDALESVPIKKRRFLLVRSPSPPPKPSSHSGDCDHMVETQGASYQRTASYSKQHQEKSIADDKTGLKDLNEEISDAVDFSGISILAAAACDSDMSCDSMNPEDLGFNGHASKADDLLGSSTCVESHSLFEVTKDQLQHRSEDLRGKSDIHLEASSTLDLPGKGSDRMKLDESNDTESSTGTLQNFPDKTGTKPSSRDSRFHWDLNTVMDAWESNCDVVVNSKPLAPDVVGANGIHNENMENIETSRGDMECGDAKQALELVDARIQVGGIPKVDYRLLDTEVQDRPGVPKDNSAVDLDCCSLPCGDGLVQEEHQLDKASVAVAVSFEETKLLHDQEMGSCTTKISSLAGGVMGPLGDPLVTDVVRQGKDDICFGSEVEAETSSSHLVSSVNVSCGCATPPSELHPKVDLLINEPTLEEDRNPASLAYFANFSADRCLTDARMGQPTQISSSQGEKHGCFHHDSQSGNTDQCLNVSSPAEKASDGNICANVINAGDLPSELVSPDCIGETECDHADKGSEAEINPCLSNSHPQQGSSNHDEFSSIGTAAGEYETTAAELTMDNDKVPVDSDVDLGATITDKSDHIISNTSDGNSAGAVAAVIDASPLDCPVSSHEASKNHMDGFVNGPAEAALGDHFDCYNESYAPQNDADRAVGMEKVDLEDDDSQYEDGELRESLLNTWGEDGAEEGESEHVDYGSDNGENDMFEAASSFPPTPLQLDHMARKNGGLPNGSHDGTWAGKNDAQHAASQPLLKCLSEADVRNVGFGKQIIGSIANKVQRSYSKKPGGDARDAPEFGLGHDRVIGYSKFLKEGDDAKEFSHSARMKSSGWDQLPECRRSSRDGLKDAALHSVGQDHVSSSMDASGAHESLKRVGSSLKRDLSSRIERPNSTDGSHRMDKPYVRASRYNDRNGLDSKAERDIGAPRSVGRGGSSRHAQGRGRGDHWADSSNRYGPSHHESSGCYGPPSFTHPASRNAAAAAVAKVESSGFVVAPDGTIVRAGGMGSASRLPRRSANAPMRSTHRSLSTRGSPIERDRACGMQRGLGHSRESPDRHAGIDWGQVGRYGPEAARERYRRPVSDDCMDSSLSLQNSISRRERSFSPRRGPVHLSRSCTRSPSRSRTRSPNMWTAPRGRSDGMNGGPGSRRHSRSPPNFKTEARMERMRSPRRRPGFENHMVGHGPTSRNHASPPRSSRWVNDRKESPDHLREHDYKQCRVFSRTDRYDLLDSSGRLKPDEYYRSMYPSRFRGFVGFVRGARHDESGEDRRGHGERYGMLHSVRQHDIDGNIKHLRYDAEDGFRAHNPPPKSSEFHRRGSPRGFDRHIESQLEDSPQRAKEEKSHFRYGRSGRPNASFESYGVRDRDDDSTTPQRRPS